MNKPQIALTNAPSAAEEFIDLRDLLQIAQRRWVLVACCALLGLVAALIVTVNMTKLYTATALVMIETRENNVVDFESVVSGLRPDTPTIANEIEILRSQALIGRLVDQLNLTEDPEFNPELAAGGFNLLSWIDPRQWLRALLAGRPAESSAAEEAELLRIGVISNVQNRLEVGRRGPTYAIEIKFTSRSPTRAAELANTIADLYIVDQLEVRYEATRRANAWLSDRLTTLREQVLVAETEAATFAAENNLISAGGETVTERQLTEINEQLISARADRAAAEADYRRVRQIVDSGGEIESLNQVVDSPAAERLREHLNSLRRQEAELSGRYGDRHPELIDLRQEIEQVNRQFNSEMQRVVNTLASTAGLARSREASLEEALREISAQHADNNQAMVRLRELERNAESQRTLYESFLSRFNEVRQEEDLQTSDARIIGEAIRPLGPSHPRSSLNIAIGLVLGLGFGGGLALLLEWLDRGLRTRKEVEAILEIPQIAAIPHLDQATLSEAGKAGITPEAFVIHKPLSTYTESLQALRTSIELSDVDDPPKVILVTSSLPNEGKTTTAISLARLIAMSGKRVLLIDADLRHPTVETMFGGTGKPISGLVEVLANENSLSDVIVKDEISDLEMIFAGRRAPNPVDLLKSARLRTVLDTLKGTYDAIIVDAAPILPVVDSRILARVCDTTVFVVRWHETPRDAARDAVRHLRDADADVAGVALAQVDLKKQRRYGYGSTYYYYGRYREYYAD